MIRLALELLGLYLLYKIIFDFIIPVAQATKQVKKQFGDIKSQMNEHTPTPRQDNITPNSTSTDKPRPKAEDYIEFEEVKN